MRRREFITLVCSAATWPFAARAQQQRLRRIGVLMSLSTDDPETKARIAVFQKALEQLGWSFERIRVDYRFAPRASEQYPPLVQELLALQPDVVMAANTPVAVTRWLETSAARIVRHRVATTVARPP
jgi:putative tryptophan/tyrosine transport system substrate-binding protein